MKPTEAGFQFPENGMRTTPRTDDVLDDNNYFGGSTFIALRNLCRQLERELHIVTAHSEKAEAECVQWRRLLQMSRDDRENDLVSEISNLKRQLTARGEQAKVPYSEPKAP